MPSSPDFDFYEDLEVARDASAQEITASYCRLARFHHPDKNLGNADATAKFQKVQATYEVLSDEYQRRVYDESEYSSRFGGGSPWSRPQAYYDYADYDIYPVEEMMFNIFFQDRFARASPRQAFRNPRPYTEMEREARNREEAASMGRREKDAKDAVKHAKCEAETKWKKVMKESTAALKEKAEMQSRLKMENMFASYSCVTNFNNQAYCEHCLFWSREK